MPPSRFRELVSDGLFLIVDSLEKGTALLRTRGRVAADGLSLQNAPKKLPKWVNFITLRLA